MLYFTVMLGFRKKATAFDQIAHLLGYLGRRIIELRLIPSQADGVVQE
ncbi:MAG: hypothetical protein ACI9HY_004469 [Planctomycetaceae bacterium]|jgi:hypothetical protein